ncbi:MAG: FAD:protein FMN transferase [Clostridiales bacterium]|nr:FAD:protein FMN transferase [Clostridiales bacterium]
MRNSKTFLKGKHKTKYARVLPLILIFALALPLLVGCGASSKSVSKSGFYFDTIITITLYGTSDESYIDGCFDLAKKYENMLSNTVEGSEVSQINDAGGEFVEVSDETLELIEAGIYYGNLSGGKFDITIGTLSNLWNFSEIAENLDSDDNEADASVLPGDDEIAEALSHVDYTKIEIDGNRVKLGDPDAVLDLGAIAKGYIADKMREYLNSEGITAGIINLGGNVLTLGEKNKDKTYSIGVQEPFSEDGDTIGILYLKDASVVSSGTYERYYRIDGKLYHHLLDTETGYPIDNGLAQVTIINTVSQDGQGASFSADDSLLQDALTNDVSMDGDALSTTCFALGLDDGMSLIESLDGVEAIFVTDDGEIYATSGISSDSSAAVRFVKD